MPGAAGRAPASRPSKPHAIPGRADFRLRLPVCLVPGEGHSAWPQRVACAAEWTWPVWGVGTGGLLVGGVRVCAVSFALPSCFCGFRPLLACPPRPCGPPLREASSGPASRGAQVPARQPPPVLRAPDPHCRARGPRSEPTALSGEAPAAESDLFRVVSVVWPHSWAGLQRPVQSSFSSPS